MNCAGWSSANRLAWYDMLSCVARATRCFSVCLHGDHETTAGECLLNPPERRYTSFQCLTLVLLIAAEYWSIAEEYTTYFEISSIYDWLLLFVSAIRIVHLLVRASSVYSMIVLRHGFWCSLSFCSWSKVVTCVLTLHVGLQTMSSVQPSRYGCGNWEEQSLLWMREQAEL